MTNHHLEAQGALRERIVRLESELGEARTALQESIQAAGEAAPHFESWQPTESSDPQRLLGSWIWDIRTDQLTWSPQLYQILGYDAGKDIPSAEKFFAAVHPEDREKLNADSARMLETGENQSTHFRIRWRDGTIRQAVVDSAAIRDEDGAFILMTGTILDLTDTLATEAKLRRQQNLFFLAQSVARVGSWTFDSDTGEVEWSLEMYKILGVDENAQPSAKLYQSLVHPSDSHIVEKALHQFAELGYSDDHEYRIIRPNDGTIRHMSTSGVPLKGAEGEILGFLGTTLDITERKELEARVSQAVKMEALGRLAGGVAHDFNNLLTVIQGFCELLSQRESHEELVHIREASEAAARLTKRLLEFSRQSVVSNAPLNINSVVRRSTALLERIIGEDIIIELDLQEELWSVTADPGQMEQILFNLAANSRDAMSRGGVFTLATRNRAQSQLGRPAVELAVTDTGEGMTDEVAANVFEPFFTTKERTKGTGLGLSTVFGIVTQNHGEITLQTAPTQGTRIEILLPQTLPVETQAIESSRPSGSSESLLILVVEDEPMIANLLERTLVRAGHTVLCATRPREAIDIFCSHHRSIELIISDVVMPEMSGPALVSHLHTVRTDFEVLFISGYPAGELDLGAIDPGGFLAKPFAPQDLVAAVGRVSGGGSVHLDSPQSDPGSFDSKS